MLAQSKKALSYSELLCKHHSGFILGNKDFCGNYMKVLDLSCEL